MNISDEKCVMIANYNLNQPIPVQMCLIAEEAQFFSVSPIGEIRRDIYCLDYPGNSESVINYLCHGLQGTQVCFAKSFKRSYLKAFFSALERYTRNKSNFPQLDIALHDTQHSQQNFDDGNLQQQLIRAEMESRSFSFQFMKIYLEAENIFFDFKKIVKMK